MMTKALRKIGIRMLKQRGYSDYAAPHLYDMLKNDLLHGCKLGIKRRLWAYRHGFFGDTTVNSDVTPQNFSNYLPDIYYYKLHPLNGDCRKWVDDKLTMRYVLAPFTDYLPKYYFDLQGAKIHRLMDCPVGISPDVTGVKTLLAREKQLALKLLVGEGGEGFYKLSESHGEFLVNNTRMERQTLDDFLSACRGYVVTEYLSAHADLREIFPDTANSIRVGVLNAPGEGPRIIGSFAKFGTSKSGVVDNVVAGGFFCGVNADDGTFFRPGRYENSRFVELPIHPDTKAPIQGAVPHWESVKGKILEICDYIPQVEWLGFDVVVTDSGFKIIEINSHQSSDVLQRYYPLLKDPRSRRYFLRAMRAKGIELDRE